MTIVGGGEVDRDGEFVDLNDFTIKDGSVPPQEYASRIPIRGRKGIFIEVLGGQLFEEGVVEVIPFSFLDTEDCTSTFINLFFNSSTFVF